MNIFKFTITNQTIIETTLNFYAALQLINGFFQEMNTIAFWIK